MKKQKIFEALHQHIQSKADEKAGYPPNCNEGYVEKDGKCVPAEKAKQNYKKQMADEKAGYPPNCNEGYVEKDGKCVPVKDSEGGDKKKMPHNEDEMKMQDKKKKKDQDKKDAGYKKKM